MRNLKMKQIYFIKKNTGVGLIEVLITTVIIAVGLLAVASLQGELIGGSGVNKTRAECQILANAKIEELRDTIIKSDPATTDDYDSILSSVADQDITGTTEVFTRRWTVSTLTTPERKEVNVTVEWGDASAENQCTVQSIIAFDNLGNSTIAANGNSGNLTSSPSTNAESSDEISKYVDIPASTPGSVVTINEQTYIAQDVITLDDGSTEQKGVLANLCSSYDTPALTDLAAAGLSTVKVRRINFDGVSGDEAIELFELTTDLPGEYCIPRIRFNGGVIIPMKGTVYSQADGNSGHDPLDVSLFTFNASETGAYCIFEPDNTLVPPPTEAEYICYVGGNCTGAVGGDDDNVLTCPATPVAATKVGPGGWRGKIGLLGIAVNDRNVCFAEEIAATPVSIDTARNYFVRHNGNNEGINRAYSCHNFLIINGTNDIHGECNLKVSNISPATLASKTIQRTLVTDNIFNPVTDISNCSGGQQASHTVTVNLNATGGSPITGDLASLSFVSCTGSGSGISAYTCVELDNASGNPAIWNYSGLTDTDDVCIGSGSYTAQAADHTVDFSVTCTATRTITIDAISTGTGTVSNFVYSGSGASCSSDILTPTCEVPVDWLGTLTATAVCSDTGASMTGVVDVASSSTTTVSISLGNCDVPTVTYVISSTVTDSTGWAVTELTCNSSLCNNLLPGTYAVAAVLTKAANNTIQTCGISVVINDASKVVTVSKTNQSTCNINVVP